MTNSEYLVQIATKYIGVKDTDPIVNKIRKTVHKEANKEPWCADFVWFCLDQIKQKPDIMRSNSCMAIWTHSDVRLRRLRPEVGSLAVWCFNGSSKGHIGIVADVLESTGIIRTVEGNTTDSDSVERLGTGVYLKARHIISPPGPLQLQGFLKPWLLSSVASVKLDALP